MKVSDGVVEIEGYKMHRMDRTRRGCGVAVYMSADVKGLRRAGLEEVGLEAIWIEVRMKKVHFLVCNLYQPPDAQAAWFDGLAVMLERAAQENLPVMMLGDFNYNFMHSCTSPGSKKLSSLMTEYGLTQRMEGPTRITQSSQTQIDLLFITDTILLSNIGKVENGLSDHA